MEFTETIQCKGKPLLSPIYICIKEDNIISIKEIKTLKTVSCFQSSDALLSFSPESTKLALKTDNGVVIVLLNIKKPIVKLTNVENIEWFTDDFIFWTEFGSICFLSLKKKNFFVIENFSSYASTSYSIKKHRIAIISENGFSVYEGREKIVRISLAEIENNFYPDGIFFVSDTNILITDTLSYTHSLYTIFGIKLFSIRNDLLAPIKQAFPMPFQNVMLLVSKDKRSVSCINFLYRAICNWSSGSSSGICETQNEVSFYKEESGNYICFTKETQNKKDFLFSRLEVSPSGNYFSTANKNIVTVFSCFDGSLISKIETENKIITKKWLSSLKDELCFLSGNKISIWTDESLETIILPNDAKTIGMDFNKKTFLFYSNSETFLGERIKG